MSEIPGYILGSSAVPRAPISLEEVEEIKASLLLDEEDAAALRRSLPLLAPRVEEILDVWYGFVGSQPHLLQAFLRTDDGRPDTGYLSAVRKRFGQWILDTARADYGQSWSDYQFEIGRRHHRSGKNRTDGARAEEHIPFRHLAALFYPITHTLRPFLESGGHERNEVDRMHQAWQVVLLQVILWSYPYIRTGDF